VKPVFIKGVGLWTPGFGTADAWCNGNPDAEIIKPGASLLKGPLKRRSSELTRIAVEVYEQASRMAGCDPSHVPSVWATAHGEHSNALRLLGMMHEGEGKVSPTSFHNSVHNTASGYASISTGNVHPSTTLTGGGELVSAAIMETISMAEALEQDVEITKQRLKLAAHLRGEDSSQGYTRACVKEFL